MTSDVCLEYIVVDCCLARITVNGIICVVVSGVYKDDCVRAIVMIVSVGWRIIYDYCEYCNDCYH